MLRYYCKLAALNLAEERLLCILRLPFLISLCRDPTPFSVAMVDFPVALILLMFSPVSTYPALYLVTSFSIIPLQYPDFLGSCL